MTKEEKIKEAWGEHYESNKELINDDGWLRHCNLTSIDTVRLSIQKKDLFERLVKNTATAFEVYFRPKSLQGIENNNGWIKLTGEPYEVDKIPNVELYNINTKGHYLSFDENEFIDVGRFTHYKPVELSQPPIY